MTHLEKRILGNTPIVMESIERLQLHISSLHDDLNLANEEYYRSEKSYEDFNDFDSCIRVILYQKAIAKKKIEIIVKELKLLNIDVESFQFGG